MNNENIKQYIDTMIWHISTNRETLGSDRMLDDVYAALKNVQELLEVKKTDLVYQEPIKVEDNGLNDLFSTFIFNEFNL